MGYRFLWWILTISVLMIYHPTIAVAQNSKLVIDENEPLFPKQQNNQDNVDENSGINDPFKPKTTPVDVPEPEKNSAPPLILNTDETAAPSTKEVPPTFEVEKSIDLDSSPPPTSEEDPLAQELLNGNDEDFKPAPLKIDGSSDAKNNFVPEADPIETKAEEIATPTPTPSPTTSPILEEEEEKPTPVPTQRASSITVPKNKDVIKTSDLISEEIDPWDDPRKQVSTNCRLQLERIKKKKILLQRADGTYMRLQEAMNGASNSKAAQMKEVTSKLGRKVLDLKKEVQVLKEKAIRLGCPGVEF